MKTKAYVQTVGGHFSSVNAYTAALAFSRFYGYDVETFEKDRAESIEVSIETPVFAGISEMKTILNRFGKESATPYYPEELKSFLGREIRKVKMRDVRAEVEEQGIASFIKPEEFHKKEWTGYVVKKFRDLIYTATVDCDEMVYASTPVEFVSEYRCFVHREKGVLGVKHYAGDWSKMISKEVMERAVSQYTNCPVAYSLDLGVTADGQTLLVECNDATSLGCYGLSPHFYGMMMIDRWKEIMT